MSLYNRTYGPICQHTTMFESWKEGHPDYVGEDNTKAAKSFKRYDVPRSMQYPGRFNNEKWYPVNRQHAEVARKLRIGADMEMRRLRNIEKSARGKKLPRKKVISFARPSWTTKAMRDEIHRLKNIVKKLNKVYGINTYSLDHIIPLRGELVSGLHIPENVRVMKTFGNIAKGNSFEIV